MSLLHKLKGLPSQSLPAGPFAFHDLETFEVEYRKSKWLVAKFRLPELCDKEVLKGVFDRFAQGESRAHDCSILRADRTGSHKQKQSNPENADNEALYVDEMFYCCYGQDRSSKKEQPAGALRSNLSTRRHLSINALLKFAMSCSHCGRLSRLGRQEE